MQDAVAIYGAVDRFVQSSGDELCWFVHFDNCGVHVTLQWTDEPNDLSLIIQEVGVRDGFCDTVWGGLKIGAPAKSAYEFIRLHYTVLDEFEDSIYFHLDNDLRFVAVAEDRKLGELVEIALLFYPKGYGRGQPSREPEHASQWFSS
jgi:hypothetical protein